ncbi:MAG: hypothetical protein ACR2GQ_07405 [Gemmatimonadota bacterium]
MRKSGTSGNRLLQAGELIDALIRENPPIDDYLFEDEGDPACA